MIACPTLPQPSAARSVSRDSPQPRWWRPEAGIFVALWLGLLATGRERLFQDPGTFWHTAVGERILASGRLPRTDALSFTFADQPWVATQWLAESAMAAVHRAVAWDGLLLATATLLAALYTWLAARLLRCGLTLIPTLLIVGLAVAASSHHFHVRPHLATLLGMACTFALLCDIESGRRRLCWLWLLPPVCALWSNLHGGVPAGLATAGLAAGGWCAARLLRWESPVRTWRDAALLAAVLVCCTAAMFCTPYGADTPRTWLRVMSLDLPDLIEEHAPLNPAHAEGWMTLLLGIAYVATLCTVRRRPRATWLLPLVWLVLSVDRVRHAPLFALVAVIALADLLPFSRLAGWLRRREWFRVCGECGAGSVEIGPNKTHRFPSWLLVPAAAVALAVAMQCAGWRVPLVGRGWARLDPALWPTELIASLNEVDRDDPRAMALFNSLDLGGFVEFHCSGRRVFIDDRCELFGGDFLRAYAAAEQGNVAVFDRWADEYGFRQALVRPGSSFDLHLAKSGDWTRRAESLAGILYQRRSAE